MIFCLNQHDIGKVSNTLVTIYSSTSVYVVFVSSFCYIIVNDNTITRFQQYFFRFKLLKTREKVYTII